MSTITKTTPRQPVPKGSVYDKERSVYSARRSIYSSDEKSIHAIIASVQRSYGKEGIDTLVKHATALKRKLDTRPSRPSEEEE